MPSHLQYHKHRKHVADLIPNSSQELLSPDSPTGNFLLCPNNLFNANSTGGRAEGDNSDGAGHGAALGPPVRHDHHQQRHAARLPAAAQRGQQPRARAAVGARALAQAHLAGDPPSCDTSSSKTDSTP